MFKLHLISFGFYVLIISIAYFKRRTFFKNENTIKEKYSLYLFSLILLFCLIFRIVNLNFNSYWLDEITSVLISSSSSFNEVILKCKEDIHPPLYQILLYFYIKVGGDSELSTRLLSVIFGVISSIGVFSLSKLIFGLKKGLELFLLFSFAYFPIYYSQESRSYSLLLMLTVLVNYYFIRTFINENEPRSKVKKYNRKDVLIYILLSVMLLLTHYFGVLIVILNISFLIFYFILTLHNKEMIRQFIKAGIVFSIIIIIYYFLWGEVFLYHLQDASRHQKQVPSGNIFYSFIYYVLNPNLYNNFLNNSVLYFIGICMLIEAVYIFFITLKKKFRGQQIHIKYFYLAFLFMWLFMPFIISFLQSVYSNSSISFRNLIISTPAVIILFYITINKSISITLDLLQKTIKHLRNMFLKIRNNFINYSFLVSIFVSILLFIKVDYYYSYQSKQDIRGAVKDIYEESGSFYSNPIIFSSSKIVNRVNYYFEKIDPKQKVLDYLPADNYLNVLSSYKTEIDKHKYLILIDVPGWTKNSNIVVNYFKTHYNLLIERNYLEFYTYVFFIN